MYNSSSIYKYRLNEMLAEVDSPEVRSYVQGIILYELKISLEQFLHKKDALLGDQQTFTLKELGVITDVLNYIRPYKRKLRISDLYHPILNIES
ncbi:MAG: hypothetical protein AAF694_02715 [Bacteroidota bacterium]